MMRRTAFTLLMAVAATCLAAPKAHQFGVIGHVQGAEARLRQALNQSAEAPNAFVVATGIKGDAEACSDSLYQQRRALFADAARPVIVVPAASDWSECRNSAGRSNAIERLNRIREVFYPDRQSLGNPRLALARLSDNAKFRSYSEYAQWEVSGVLYATLNLPSNNNRFLRAAGRNSEFEDRLVANRNWLLRLFRVAERQNLDAIVLFAEADLSDANTQEGFKEVKKQIAGLMKTFKGKLLLIDSAPAADAGIQWRGNIGHLSVGSGVATVRFTPGAAMPFSAE